MTVTISNNPACRLAAIKRFQYQLHDLMLRIKLEESKAKADKSPVDILLNEQARVKKLKEHLEFGNPFAEIDIHSCPQGGLYGNVRIDGIDIGSTESYKTAVEVIEAASAKWKTPFHEIHTWSQDGQIILF